MRSLPDDLLRAQRQPAVRPYVRLEVRERAGWAPRPRWARLYDGPEPDDHCAIAIAADGAFVRFSNNGTNLLSQVIAAPGAGSPFGLWTIARPDSRLCAVAASGSELRAFTVDDLTPTDLYEAVSTDNGATWSAWTRIHTAAGAIEALAVAGDGAGRFLLLYTVGAALYTMKRSAGAWGAAAAAGLSFATITGLAVCYRLDWLAVIAGTEAGTNNPGVWQALYGDGYSQTADTWSALSTITPGSAGSGIVYGSPALCTDGGIDWLSYRESYTGPGGYSRPWWSHDVGDPVDGAWREPVPFDLTTGHQLALAYRTDPARSEVVELWAATPYGVWQADIAMPILDLSDDVLSLTVQEQPEATRAEVVLDNRTGRYAAAGAGALDALRPGAEVQFRPGLRVPGRPPAVIGGIPLLLAGWELTTDGRCVLHCTGYWELLAATRVRSAFQWAAGGQNVFQLVRFLLARAGLSYATLTGSATLTSLKPAFAVQPGESIRTAVLRLLDKVEDRIRWERGAAIGVLPQASDAAVYTYGGHPGAGHAILSGVYGTRATDPNYVHSLAGTALGEAMDWSSIAGVYQRSAVDQDPALATGAEADARAAARLRRAQQQAGYGHIVVPTNIAQELYDVVAITDARAGISDLTRRVGAIGWEYTPGGRYQQTLTLEAP